jgi:hypothetical protein
MERIKNFYGKYENIVVTGGKKPEILQVYGGVRQGRYIIFLVCSAL